MTHQRFHSLLPSLSIKGKYHLLLRRGVCYLLPFSLISSGVTLADTTRNSRVEPLPSFNEESHSSSSSDLESSDISTDEPEEPAVPNYDSVPPMRLDDEEQAPVQVQKSESESKTALEPIEPLTNSSETPDIDPEETEPEAREREETATESPQPEVTAEETEPEAREREETATESPQPEVTAEETEPEAKEEPSQATDNQDYVDLDGYPQTGEEALPDPQVEISDRDNNCTTVIENGELVSGSCNLSQEENSSEQTSTAPQDLPELPTDFQQPTANEPQQPQTPERENYSTYTPPDDLPELQLADNGDTNLMFPLSRASRISSGFGWRNHPIHGHRHFHTGTDFAAPTGTPVVATRSGRVAFADYRGGYGLIVGLHHDEDKHESRYAHLSQIHVQPGQWVEQGTVIGRVGSTGTSSGSHLHFEWRVRKGHRWVAVDATEPLLVARDNINSSQIVFNDTDAGNGEPQETSNNFFASLPEMLHSVSREPASWMAIPELDFLENTDFDRAHQRQAAIGNISQLSDSISALPFSLPQVLASLFSWQPPQLFAEDQVEEVPQQQATSNQSEFTYRYPNSEEIERWNQARNLESRSNLEALGTFPFPSPDNPQELSKSP
ncbi:MAG: peptidoglycan DD-metalloendopeptidase family protein [Halothece sp.]